METEIRSWCGRCWRAWHAGRHQAYRARIWSDRKTVKAWRRRGGWRPRVRERRRAIDAFAAYIEQRAPEVGWNSVVLHRELQGLGFTGYLQVQRYLQPLRAARHWATLATTRFETGPGEQAQVDFGQLRLWVGDLEVTAHLFVFTLGYSGRLWARAYQHERLDVVLDGHERAPQHFGGVSLSCLYDNHPGARASRAQDPLASGCSRTSRATTVSLPGRASRTAPARRARWSPG